MTLNGVMAVILRYFTVTEFGSFGANYVKLVEVRPWHTVWQCLRQKCSVKNLVSVLYDLWP